MHYSHGFMPYVVLSEYLPYVHVPIFSDINIAICSFKKAGEHASGFVGTLTIKKKQSERTVERTVTVLVTNYHVFQALDDARGVTYEFGYHQEQPDDPSLDLQPKMITGEELIPENANFYINERIAQLSQVSTQMKCDDTDVLLHYQTCTTVKEVHT